MERAKQILRVGRVDAGAAIFDLEQHHAAAEEAAHLDDGLDAGRQAVLERVLDEVL